MLHYFRCSRNKTSRTLDPGRSVVDLGKFEINHFILREDVL